MMTLVPMVLVVSLAAGASRAVAGAPTVEAVSVRVTNPLPARRPTETVALKIATLVKLAPTLWHYC